MRRAPEKRTTTELRVMAMSSELLPALACPSAICQQRGAMTKPAQLKEVASALIVLGVGIAGLADVNKLSHLHVSSYARCQLVYSTY